MRYILVLLAVLGIVTACAIVNVGDKENCIDIDKGPLIGDKINATCKE